MNSGFAASTAQCRRRNWSTRIYCYVIDFLLCNLWTGKWRTDGTVSERPGIWDAGRGWYRSIKLSGNQISWIWTEIKRLCSQYINLENTAALIDETMWRCFFCQKTVHFFSQKLWKDRLTFQQYIVYSEKRKIFY